MRKKCNTTLLLLLLLIVVPSATIGGPELSQDTLPESELSTDDWRSETEGLDFGERKAPEPEEEEEPIDLPDESSFEWNFEALGPFILAIIIFIIAALIIYLVIRQLRDRDLRAEARDANTVVSLEEIEQNLPESDLERHLREALQRGEHRLALRLYYLLILQQMSKVGWIEWKREKTNYEYLIELQAHSTFQSFSEVTLAFERVWYGEQPIDHERFVQLEPSFKNLLNRIE